MNHQPFIIKKSPFAFLKLLIVVEFLFALLPFAVVFIRDIRDAYEGSTLAGSVSYSWLLAIVLTTLQVLLLCILFVTWYFPSYQIDERQIIHLRANLFEDKKLVDIQAIVDMVVKQGFLARRLNYGSLVMYSSGQAARILIKNISGPAQVAQFVSNLIGQQAYIDTPLSLPEPKAVPELIAGGENQYVEFKASLMWDHRRQMANKELYVPVMKNLVAFMNTVGGTLLIGVADDGEVLGLDPDLSTMRKADVDGFENVINLAFGRMVGIEYRQFLDVTFPDIDDKTICAISVRPSPRPAYLVHKGTEQFYIRAGNGSQPLTVSKAARYIQDHFEQAA